MKKLKTFEDVKKENRKKIGIYEFGTLKDIRQIKMPSRTTVPLYDSMWFKPWQKVEELFSKEDIPRYRIPRSMRSWGKTKILTRLNIFRPDHMPEAREAYALEEPPLPQLPLVYPRLAGLNDVIPEEGTGEASQKFLESQLPIQREDFGGFLQNLLEKGIDWWLSIEELKARRKLYEEQAKAASAQAQLMQMSYKPQIKTDFEKILPIVLIGGGAFLIGSTLMKKKGNI